MARYVRGEVARMSATFAVVDPLTGVETLTTPTSTTVVVTKPDGTVVTPAPSVVADAPGRLHAETQVDVAGLWRWRMVGTGAAAGVFEGSFTVLESPMDDLLTIGQFRAAKRTSADDDTIQLYIDAATQAIVARHGRIGPVVEQRRGGGLNMWLSRQASSIVAISEGFGDPLGIGYTALDPTDYTLAANGVTVRRLAGGAHPADVWGDYLDVTYMPLDTTADRQRVVIALVKLDLEHNPGKTSEQIADWSATYADNSLVNYGIEREMLLDTLAVNVAPFA